ncbi:short chain dehydrogenase/reductase dpmpG isoform X3 [Ixodes scapularis]|uniref:short chain dehydrogenase/reductase dpmpG isoform X3 n=1 Tax=Ixodes scapularis TaxID=6945 RepID=UPI001A9E4B24|nr:short chain dehydrogenase/reductase dpmpG isoform X3 [Ixodes scapularis]
MSLPDRLALVTGGGSGIGKAVCHALSRDGAIVVVADINLDAAKATVAELKAAGKDHVALHVDVGDSTSVATLMNNIGSQSRTPLSIVVTCAGVAEWHSVVDTTEQDYDAQMRVNLKPFVFPEGDLSSKPSRCQGHVGEQSASGRYRKHSQHCGQVWFSWPRHRRSLQGRRHSVHQVPGPRIDRNEHPRERSSAGRNARSPTGCYS